MTADIARTALAAAKGEYELYKTTHKHDETTEHPQ